MKTVQIELKPCKVCKAQSSQVIHKSDQKVEDPWFIYCNSCGRNEAEFYGKSKEEAIMRWNEREDEIDPFDRWIEWYIKGIGCKHRDQRGFANPIVREAFEAGAESK